MRARPHHLIDIIVQHAAGEAFTPSDYGHAVHTVAAAVLADPGLQISFGVGADDICAPCKHLVGGRCDDVLSQLDPPLSKQEYNDALDEKLLAFLGLQEGQVLSFGQYVAVLRAHQEGLAELCTHPGENLQGKQRLLQEGLEKLGGPA